MINAEFVKVVDVNMPNDDLRSLDVYIDPSTGRLFGLDSDFTDAQEEATIVSPFNKHAEIKVN